jgi:hypothetical protein
LVEIGIVTEDETEIEIERVFEVKFDEVVAID